ncbi:MAG: hypothetical protein NTZ43_06310 [Gemmatimonadetes bacterium]|nr:hypothetical protein [Gemmatimonadota bacterium]
MKYIVEVDGHRVEVELEGDQARVNGGPAQQARLTDVPGTPVRLVDLDGEMHRVMARRDGTRGRYLLSLDGRRFAVEALDERTRAIRDLTVAAAPTGPQPLRAPMPGLVVRAFVAVGDLIEAGQPVIAMEAMKMENELRAPAAGRVKSILVAPGTVVEKGALLVEFE